MSAENIKTEYLLDSDKKIVAKIANGWKAYRDFNNAMIYKGDKSMKISVACYRRLSLAGLAEL